MSPLTRVPKDLVILVCDSRKALILKNDGSEIRPKLEITEHFEPDGAPSGIQDSDRSGRRADGGSANASYQARSAMEAADPGKAQAAAFAAQIVERLVKHHSKVGIGQLVLVAPPTFLGFLRDKMSDELRQLITSEVSKHLTEMPVEDIEKILVSPW